AEPVEHHRLEEAGTVVVDRGGPAEVTHCSARLDERVETDQGEVLRVLKNGVGELADRIAPGVARYRPRARSPRHLADVAAERARAEDAVAGGADIAAAVRSLEKKVQGALPDIGQHDRAGAHSRAGSGAEGRRRRDRDQGARHPIKGPVGRGSRRAGQSEGQSVDRSLLVLAGTAPEQDDDRSSCCDESSACKHFRSSRIGWDTVEPQSKARTAWGTMNVQNDTGINRP